MKYLTTFLNLEEYENNKDILDPPNVSYIVNDDKIKYKSLNTSPLYIEAINDLTVSFSTNNIEYSLDKRTWNSLSAGTSTPTILSGEKVFFRAEGIVPTSAGIGTFAISNKCNIGGNVMSMIWGSKYLLNKNMPYDYNLRRLFFGNSNIVDAQNLIIASENITLKGCEIMFKNCTNLISPPILPSMILGERAYANMFEGCTSLEIGPTLPALEVTATYCYNAMFANCSKLRYLKAMLLSTPNNASTKGVITGNWLLNVASSGVFVKNSKATWNVSGVHGIPSGWSVQYVES